MKRVADYDYRSCFDKSLLLTVSYLQDNAEDGGQSPEQGDEGQGSEHEDGNDRTRVDEGEDSDANHGAEWQEGGGEGAAAGNTWQCEVCHIWSKVASHLRQSKKCLTELKSKPQFQFKGSEDDEVFIAKFSMITFFGFFNKL